ncbi:MAG: EFR1 family ferrodoxin [Defluviitaleaceae bacterium]|nr:EFR1 family ferrodoxin [Defluviitaleaceae bacterium]
MLTLYFSATGNSEFVARVFSKQMGAVCLSIEDNANFMQTINAHDTIAFCYPIYGSRVPRNMREFVAKHRCAINGKKIIIFATQGAFSGDGARVFTDMFERGAMKVIYAEHIKMPNNICNTPILRNTPILGEPSDETVRQQFKKAEAKIIRICKDIKNGIVKKRGFAIFAKLIGNIQGLAWQGSSKNIAPAKLSAEGMVKKSVRIHKNCTACNLCVNICPVKNFRNENGTIIPQGNCIICYRCVNRCPQKAVTAMGIHLRPRWQYKGALQREDAYNVHRVY